MKIHVVVAWILGSCLLCTATDPSTLPKFIMKTAIQKMNRTDVWIEELDLKAKGLIVRLVVGAELSPEEAKGMQVAARSSLGKAIPVTFLNSVTVNPGNVTYVDWIGKSDAKSTISSIDVKWKTESRSFHIPQTQSGR